MNDSLNAFGQTPSQRDLLKIQDSGYERDEEVCLKKIFGIPSGPPFLLLSRPHRTLLTSSTVTVMLDSMLLQGIDLRSLGVFGIPTVGVLKFVWKCSLNMAHMPSGDVSD